MPESRIRFCALNANLGYTRTGQIDVDDLAPYLFLSLHVLKSQQLPGQDWLAQLDQGTMCTDYDSGCVLRERLTVGSLPGNKDGNRQKNPLASPVLRVLIGAKVGSV